MKTLETYNICIWPNRSWCYSHSVDLCMQEQGLSDDYEQRNVVISDEVKDIDDYIETLVSRGLL